MLVSDWALFRILADIITNPNKCRSFLPPIKHRNAVNFIFSFSGKTAIGIYDLHMYTKDILVYLRMVVQFVTELRPVVNLQQTKKNISVKVILFSAACPVQHVHARM